VKQEQVQKIKSTSKKTTTARRVDRFAIDQRSPSGKTRFAN
jgi:hypothetical protein